jgi:hypothetical protein
VPAALEKVEAITIPIIILKTNFMKGDEIKEKIND